MSKKIEIDAVQTVRKIRDQEAEVLKDMTDEEIIAFFRKARRRPQRRSKSSSNSAANKGIQPTARKTRRG